MTSAFRIAKTSRLSTAFDGIGSKLAGGRWNHKGVPIVYCAGSLSLATLETLVHLEDDIALQALFSYVPLEIPTGLIEILPSSDLPENWNAAVTGDATRDVGSRWLLESRSAVLQVPSAVVPSEWNYLLNPMHPNFEKIRRLPPQSFSMDPRLKKNG